MDVIGRDDLPTETKASAAKLINGSATFSEDNATAVTGGAGRKKSKRKNKAKNSHREDAEAELKIEAPPTTVTTAAKVSKVTVTSSKAAATTLLVGESVNSNSSNIGSSSDRSSHSNGLPTDDSPATSVDAISEKLERCVQISRNGLTNGLPKHGDQSAVGRFSLEDGTGTHEGTESGKEPTGKSAKKKHRSRQAKKTQATNTSCTFNGEEQADDEVEEEEEKGEPLSTSTPMPTDLPELAIPEDKTNTSPCGNCKLNEHREADQLIQKESCIRTGNDPNRCVLASSTSTSTSSTTLPDSAAVQPAECVVSAETGQSALVQITYQVYESERQMPAIMSLIQKDLSEPYSIYTYRYFIHNWPKLCFLALHEDTCVGAIVCKLDIHRQDTRRGYIAMLAVDKDYRKLKIGTTLVQKAIQVMLDDNADEVVLETEITNQPALRLYENLGFVRDKRLFHYYLNGVDALRLKLWFR